jgi:hypothetical protein
MNELSEAGVLLSRRSVDHAASPCSWPAQQLGNLDGGLEDLTEVYSPNILLSHTQWRKGLERGTYGEFRLLISVYSVLLEHLTMNGIIPSWKKKICIKDVH